MNVHSMKRAYAGAIPALVFALGVGAGGYYKPFEPTQGQSERHLTAASSKQSTYSVKTKSKSFFARDKDGNLIPETRQGLRYFQIGEGEYSFQRTILSDKTALVVMDPWADSGADLLNRYFAPVFRSKVLPLVRKSIELGIRVLVLTNNPKITADYSSEVFPELQALADGGRLKILYHQDFDDQRFADYLRAMSVDTLIYSGFASNLCVIGRSTGMIPMQSKGFKLFFVPEASAAVEYKTSWKSGDVHQATTSLISQWVAELIKFDDFMLIPPQTVK